MTPELKTKWVEALRSGNYKQARGALKNTHPDVSYCCLGVLADVVGKDPLTVQYGGFLGKEICEEIGLPPASSKEIDGFSGGPQAVSEEEESSFQLQAAARNDAGWDFERIADWIEQEAL